MNTINLINFAYDIFKEDIRVYKKDPNIEDYNNPYKLYSGIIEINNEYGVCLDNCIEFVFKTGKKEDNILKTFVTQFISKYTIKQCIGFDNGKMIYPKRKDVINKLKNSSRIVKYYFYTTLYGIGYFCYFMNNETQNKTNLMLGYYLKENGINYKNEFSEAGWVYRFLINDDVKKHNELLKNFNI